MVLEVGLGLVLGLGLGLGCERGIELASSMTLKSTRASAALTW